ncbi:hypothetical protein LO739_17170 [Leclercia adecarboxylata]|uniref:hypothetical protein n=1 Tax=Leclercia adecarboxylata TaxID=83655 RepID=UPI001E466FBE|nr:hypothetical protein [Leclercia adecarboxylata]UFM68553.1 hypothetical protein LO739_17170 [Leclercia adecarboxylata]
MNEEEFYSDELKYIKLQHDKMKRRRTVLIVVPIAIGILLLAYSTKIANQDDLKEKVLNFLGVLSLISSAVALVMAYLQTGFKKFSAVEFIKSESTYNSEPSYGVFHEYTLDKINKIEEEINALHMKEKNNPSLNNPITKEEKDELVKKLQNQILKDASEGAAIILMENIQNKLNSNKERNEINELFLKTLERLKKETESLTRRGNLNLTLGILTTVIGLCLLGYFVITANDIPQDKFEFIVGFIPRLSLVILIEVFAYFFLKLYKSSLSEIKYFQNEMTNIEGKFVAIKCAEKIPDANVMSNIVNNIAQTERNSLLEKGQTTAEIEMAKLENHKITNFSHNFIKAFELNKKS